jgi:hypothetical protein
VAPAATPAAAQATSPNAAGQAEVVKKPQTGSVALAVTPWAQVRVDGVLKGISPPMKQLTLPAGPHTFEFHNPASPPVKQQVEVRANRNTVVRQEF